jgi:hypothetical protein
VIQLEAFFFRSKAGDEEVPLNLHELVSAGKVIELGVTAAEIAPVVKFCSRFFAGELHPGEIEALALLTTGKAQGHHFCTADGPAIEAAVMLGLRERLVCFETVLGSVGFTKPLEPQYKRGFFDGRVKEGSRRKMMLGP